MGLRHASAGDQHTDAARGVAGVGGRTQEIHADWPVAAVGDPPALGERTIWMDCDVIQADGARAPPPSPAPSWRWRWRSKRPQTRRHQEHSALDYVAAISVGIVDGEALLDLVRRRLRAEVDMNIVKTGDGRFIEVQVRRKASRSAARR
jgi:ribonuclease PH